MREAAASAQLWCAMCGAHGHLAKDCAWVRLATDKTAERDASPNKTNAPDTAKKD